MIALPIQPSFKKLVELIKGKDDIALQQLIDYLESPQAIRAREWLQDIAVITPRRGFTTGCH